MTFGTHVFFNIVFKLLFLINCQIFKCFLSIRLIWIGYDSVIAHFLSFFQVITQAFNLVSSTELIVYVLHQYVNAKLFLLHECFSLLY